MNNTPDTMLERLLKITEENRRNGIIDVTISADSIWSGKRITTFILHRFPKGQGQAEFNTHRSISKNSASSRAINKPKYIENIIKDPYIPIWTTDKKGMVGELVTDECLIKQYTTSYLNKMLHDIEYVQQHYPDVHKQDSNTQLDQYVRIPIIATSTNWEYFFKLRCASDVKPEFRRIALEMERLYNESTPIETDCHLPWIKEDEKTYNLHQLLTLSTARSAWISYANHENLNSFDVANNTVVGLWNNKHYSPFDHCAKSSTNGNLYDGWLEYRKWYAN